MYKVHLFQYKSKFNTVFNVNPGTQGSSITYFFNEYILIKYSYFILDSTYLHKSVYIVCMNANARSLE
jgi:hypothetical protein